MPNRSQYSGRTIHGIIPIMQRNRRFHGNYEANRRKKRHRGRWGGRQVQLENRREAHATKLFGKSGPWGWLFHT